MTLAKPVQDSDFYHRRTQELIASGYPVSVIDYNFFTHDQITSPHSHDEVEIQYVVSGQMLVTCGNKSFTAGEGDILFINRHVEHSNTPMADNKCILRAVILNPYFVFGLGQLELENKYINPVIFDSKISYLHLTPKSRDYLKIMAQMSEIFKLNEYKPICYEMLTKSSILQLWTYIYKYFHSKPSDDFAVGASTQDEQRIEQAILYIYEHFTEPITLDDIAGFILVSKSECCRCFKRTLNVTPFEYLMKYRILESTKRMRQKPYESIAEIAGSVGFNNTSYYSKIFKKYMGCTPTEYRHTC